MTERKIQAAKEDRERFFKVADVFKMKDNIGLTPEQIAELEEVKTQWRDMTALPGFPDIDWPLPIPEWFPNPHFASCWKAGETEE